MILGGWRSHHQAWTSYRSQRERLVRELDAIPCARQQLDGCADCCDAKNSRRVEWLASVIRAVALSEDYHLIMHRQQLARTVARRQAREQARRRVA